MDLALYGRVLWRFKFLVIAGFIAAIALATLSFAKVSFAGGTPKLTYRKAETWASYSRVLITQPGFSFGSIQASQNAVATLGGLTGFYSQLMYSSALRERIGTRYPGAVSASPVPNGSGAYGAALPMINIQALSPSAAAARALDARATSVFMAYIAQLQHAGRIPASQRVALQVINPPAKAVVVAGRKKTLPIVIFLMLMLATLGLAFVLENLRPRVRVLTDSGRAETIGDERPVEASGSSAKAARQSRPSMHALKEHTEQTEGRR